jgi:hypothetical protein
MEPEYEYLDSDFYIVFDCDQRLDRALVSFRSHYLMPAWESEWGPWSRSQRQIFRAKASDTARLHWLSAGNDRGLWMVLGPSPVSELRDWLQPLLPYVLGAAGRAKTRTISSALVYTLPGNGLRLGPLKLTPTTLELMAASTGHVTPENGM